ncbi:alpha-tocopherol transfer protein-like [Metopolophium dirhodum]|uniref:alpha-tocopherol transfer protein-like n=1 Tax=Metopolophium dirhodum TaxID=44670 RepID=UPI0029900926|nr:alpha-tocopherol transfer protein-like [Metopolophium dirhodum]
MPLINDGSGIVLKESSKIKEKSIVPITADEEYAKNPEISKENIEDLRKWLVTQPHLPQNIPEEMLILFYHSCFFDMEQTKTCIEIYYTLKTETPEFFANRDVFRPELVNALNVLDYGCLPIRSPNDYQIIYHKLRIFEANKYVFNDGVKLLIMAMDACFKVDGTCPGYIFLFDMRGVRLGHLTRLSISSLRKFFTFIQEGLPVRLKGIHVLNTQSIVDKIMMLLKPFMKKELLSMVHFYTERDVEKIYGAVPKECLLEDYGGLAQSIEKTHVHFIEWMKLMKPLFENDYQYKCDESKRPKKSKKSISTSFKSLEID